MPRIGLPDGTHVELPDGEPIGSVLPPSAVAARVDGDLRDLSFVPEEDVSVEPVDLRTDDGLHVLRHSTGHVLAQAVSRLWPGTHLGVGPSITDGFYYDLEIPAHVSADDLPTIEEEMRAIVAADQPFVREEVPRDDALARLGGPALQTRDRGGAGRGWSDDGRRRSRRHRDLLPQRRLGGPLPRAARPVHRAAGRLQAHRCLGRLLARRREEPAADPDLRHGVGDRGRPRGVPRAARRGRAARSPEAGRRPRSVLVPRGDRLGARDLPPARRSDPQDHGGLLAPSTRGGRLRVRELTPHHEAEPLRHERAPGVVRRRDVPAHGGRRRHRVLPEADELPVPHPDLPEQGAQLP